MIQKGSPISSFCFYVQKLSVRSVQGQTYCAKTGRKLAGQVSETFIIADWTEVLTGSYRCKRVVCADKCALTADLVKPV